MAVERKRYNDAVAAYNRTARGFPAFLLRPVLDFPRQYVYFPVSTRQSRLRHSDTAHLATRRSQPGNAGASPTSCVARSEEGHSRTSPYESREYGTQAGCHPECRCPRLQPPHGRG